MRLTLLLIALAPGPAKSLDPPQIRLPEVVVVPTPGTPVKLSADTLYVFDADSDCLVTTSPPGVLAVAKEAGPVKIKGVFADGTGKVETRTYKGKWIWTVDVLSTGRAELLVIPIGITDEVGIQRRMIDANAGPRPPPVDPVKPPPVDPVKPPPVDPVAVKAFRVIFVKESGSTLPAPQSSIPGAKAIRDYLAAKTTPEGGVQGWREFDPQSNAANDPSDGVKKLWAAAQPKVTTVPCMVVQVNDKVEIVPYEKDAASTLAKLKTYGGN